MTPDQFILALNTKWQGSAYTVKLDKPGPKYTRVIIYRDGAGSSYCFLDGAGNIYKCAGWKAPAKGVRATLAHLDVTRCDPYGSWLYR